jgi:aminopeptidase N
VQVVSEALMVRDYAAAFGDCYEQNSTTASDGTVVNALLYPGTDADQVLARAEECLEYYVSHIGPYPYPAFTVVEGRIPPGVMEYPTLIMISDQRFSDGRWPVTIAHETAHQWFYNLVGNDQVRSAWLDEGLAEYMTIALISESSVSQKAELLQNDLNSARDAVNNRPDETPSLPLSAFSVWGDYYDNAYAKPALMLEELSRGIGPEGFDELIRSYYNQCRFKIAHPADFINLASQTAGRDLSNWFDQWLSTSAMPGYPAQ